VGNQDIVLYTQAGGTSNQGIGPGGAFNFEDPVNTNTGVADGAKFEGWWGQNDQNNDGTIVDVNGPVLVGDLLDYLHAFNPFNNTPVFLFDLNQTGAQKDLWAYGQVTILDATDQHVKATWYMDNNLNSPSVPNDHPAPWVYVPGSYSIQGDTALYEESYTGSGFDDYAMYAATMNLDLFGADDWFVVEFNFDWLNDGGEEFFMTGTFVPPDTPPIPEPSTIILLGLGLLGIVGMRFKKR
jgi:hypothetical protein